MSLNKIITYPKILSFILGSLFVLALPPYYIFILPFICLSGLLYLLRQNPNKSFALGYWFGFGFFAFGLSWIGNAVLVDAASFGWLYPLVLLGAGGVLGLFFAFPAWLTKFFSGIWAKVIAFAAFYTLFEWLRSFIFTGFPWNQLGSMFAFDISLLQLASVMGTYGLTFLLILISAAPVIYFCTKSKLSVFIPTTLFLIIWGFGSFRIHQLPAYTPSSTTIRIVQPSIPQTMKWDQEYLENNFKQYIKLTRSQPLDNIDLVIWGETATPFQLDMAPQYLNWLKPAIPQGGYLLTGLVRLEFDQSGNIQPLNSMFIIDDKTKILDYYDKVHLVPFGEYIPLRNYLPEWIRPVANTIVNFKKGEGFKLHNIKNIPSFSTLICYEIIFPSQVVDKNNRPKWLINLTNDGWYGESAGPYQHLVSTQLRAIEEGITIVRVANSGISSILYTTGNIINSLDLNESNILDVSLPETTSVTTIYGAAGNSLILILCLSNVILAYLISRKARRAALTQH